MLEADQNRVAAKIDARGKRVTQQTDAARGTLSWVQDPKGQRVNYTYDAMKRVVRTESVQDAKRYHNDYTYQGDKLVRVRHNTSDNAAEDVTYAFAYDAVNRPTAVRVGKQLLSETAYNANGTVQKVTYGNGGKAAYTYDSFKRVTGVTYDGAAKPRFQYAYDSHGQIAQVTDTEMGRVITSEYDLADRPMRKTTRFVDGSTYVAQVGYDTFSNLQHFTEKISGIGTFKTTFAYDTENRPTQLNFGSAGQVSYTYDGLGRLQNQTVTVGKTPILSAYGYVLGGHGTGSTSHLVETIAQMGAYLSYIYDDCGNIIAVSDGVKQITYVYDKLGQLIRANDPHDATAGSSGTTWVYAYDLGGNILSKKAYAYTTGTLGAAVHTDTYTYGDANWKDKLTAFNGKSITYDAIGNPLKDNTWTYTWGKGRQLQYMVKNGDAVYFYYNEDGVRLQKTATGTTGVTKYSLHGKNIVHLTNGKNNLHFFYDARNKPAVVTFNGTAYAYLYNLQGDVIALIDSSGKKVVEYKYDAWGRILSKTGTMASTLGTLNPFRYRGYVYDEETGLYYLRSRYYKPNWARFINADQQIRGNLFAYCKNDPNQYADFSGKAPSPAIYPKITEEEFVTKYLPKYPQQKRPELWPAKPAATPIQEQLIDRYIKSIGCKPVGIKTQDLQNPNIVTCSYVGLTAQKRSVLVNVKVTMKEKEHFTAWGIVSVMGTMGVTGNLIEVVSSFNAPLGERLAFIDGMTGCPGISDTLDALFPMYYYTYEIDNVEELSSVLDWKE